MKILCAALAAAGMALAGSVQARPVIIEPSATLPAPPGGYYRYGNSVAIDGDYALINAYRPNPTDPGANEVVAALVYRRTASGWVYDSTLYETSFDPANISYTPAIAMRDGLAALNFGGIFRRTPTGWVRESGAGGLGGDIEYSNGRFAFGTGEGDWGANVAERDATGTWRFTRIQGARRDGDNDNNGGPLDLDGDTLALSAQDVSEGESGGPRLYRYRAGIGWGTNFHLSAVSPLPTGVHLALRGRDFFVEAATAPPGTYLFRNEGPPGDDWPSNWPFRGLLQSVDSYTSRAEGGALEASPEFVFQRRFSTDLGASVYHVFRANEEGRYVHTATLADSDRSALGGHLDADGRRVIVASPGFVTGTGWVNEVRIFDLPEASLVAGTVLLDRFTASSPSSYQHSPGSNFVVTTVGNQTVYRQQYLAGDARAIHTASERRDGGIQVDVRPRAYNGNDRWFGLITRFTDDQNYYYVTVRSSNRIELKRMAGGTIASLASAPLGVTLRNFRLRLESVGAYHRVFVDDRLVLEARDATFARGRLGVMTSRASADFDNLVITPNGYSTIYANAFAPADALGAWANTGPGSWSKASSGVYAQNSVAGDARAIIGAASAEDQSITVRARAIAYAIGTQERWFGAMLRYVDDRNYVYVSLRNSNRISLRRLVDGQIQILAEAPFTVTAGAWYTLRAEALPDATHIYVNGEPVLAGPALTTSPRGQVGLVTYKTAADFDDFLAYQP